MAGAGTTDDAESQPRVAVVHWLPLEQYPPAQNLLRELGVSATTEVLCLTTRNDRGWADFSTKHVRIVRWPFPSRGLSRWWRLILMAGFQVWCTWRLFLRRPSVVLYYEPHSAGAVLLYIVLCRKVRLFVHNHEYREPSHFSAPGNRVFAIFHWFEKHVLYHRAEWISHTNEHRVRLFLNDLPAVVPDKLHAIPNLPPREWLSSGGRREVTRPVRLIYVGAVSFADTFIREFVEWVQASEAGSLVLTLMVNNCHKETQRWLESLDDERITVNTRGIDYSMLPTLLMQHDVGVILYRGTTPNYIYNAPNKLFEYLICGLEVWYPVVMLGVEPYRRDAVNPRVIPVDFEVPQTLDESLAGIRRDRPNAPWQTTCDEAFRPLISRLCDHSGSIAEGDAEGPTGR